MDELTRILNLAKDERTEADLAYLKEHEAELSEEQQTQLEQENDDGKVQDKPTTPDPIVAEAMKKSLGQAIKSNFPVVIKDKGNGMLEAIVASNTLDRHGEIIDMKGLNTKKYMTNPVVAYGHNYDEPPIAKTVKLTKTHDGKLVAQMQFAVDIYDKAKLIYELYKGGFMQAFSIGIIPEEMKGNTYTKSEMIEFSTVLIGANPDALMLAVQMGLDIKKITVHNNLMDIKTLLEKIAKDGKDSLTLAEVKFLNTNKDDLTPNQVKELTEILTPDEDDSKELKTLTETVKTLKAELDEFKENETIKTKNISGQGDGKQTIGISKTEVSKELKFLKYIKGVQSGNYQEYLDVVGKDAMNTSGNVVIPPTEFLQEIQRLEESVGVAAQYADVHTGISGAGVKYVLGDNDLEIFDTAESGVKKSTKLTYKEKTLLWRKFAGILPITDELTEDSAVDLWRDATNRFARAYAKRADQLVFTETAAGGNTKNGIIHESGTNIVTPVGNNLSDITWEDIYKMIYGVVSMSADNGRFFLNRTVLGVLAQLKDQFDRPLWQASIAEGIPATIAGKPYTETLVLPGVEEDDTETAFIVFGDLKYATLGTRSDLSLKMFDSGLVGDPDDEDQSTQVNLLTQDVQALRAVKRMNAVVRFPAAFSVLKTAGLS